MLALYENIKKYRKEAHMTQEELARRTGYTDRSSVAKIEKGAVDLSQSKIKQFADALGVTAGQLLGWDEEPEDIGAMAAKLLQDSATAIMVKNYLSLEESDRAAVRALVASLAAKTQKKD